MSQNALVPLGKSILFSKVDGFGSWNRGRLWLTDTLRVISSQGTPSAKTLPAKLMPFLPRALMEEIVIGFEQTFHLLSAYHDACNDGSRLLGGDTPYQLSTNPTVRCLLGERVELFASRGRRLFLAPSSSARTQRKGHQPHILLTTVVCPGDIDVVLAVSIMRSESLVVLGCTYSFYFVPISGRRHAHPAPFGLTVEVEALEKRLTFKVGREAAPFATELLDQVTGNASELPMETWVYCSRMDVFALAHSTKHQVALLAERTAQEADTVVTELEQVKGENRDLRNANETLLAELTEAKLQIEGLKEGEPAIGGQLRSTDSLNTGYEGR
uniref:Uncharacterized protein n=1 Tax=Cannabis sativa TaxID=3483 RepID=A0A803PRY7_CANSA